jgi:hypothetical protein
MSLGTARVKGQTFRRSNRGSDKTKQELFDFLFNNLRIPAGTRVTFEIQPQDPARFEWITVGVVLTASQMTKFLAQYPYLSEDTTTSDD